MGTAIAALLALLVGGAGPASASPWITKGGDYSRSGFNNDSVGHVTPEVWWNLPTLGHSMTQPIVAGHHVYHVAGRYLYKLSSVADRSPVVELATDIPLNHPGRPTSSTPAYSPESKLLYVATADGRVWAYNTETSFLHPSIQVSYCPIVGSPLVIRHHGRDLVVVSDKNDGCSEGVGGKVYLIWGLDRPEEAVVWDTFEDLSGSWMTPSAVPVPNSNPPEFVLGADGISGCPVRKFTVEGTLPYRLVGTPFIECSSSGFAGSFATGREVVSWLDTGGRLFVRNAASGKRPASDWPTLPINVPALIHPQGRGFTNTEPAIDLETGTIYVTLRNYRQPGDGFDLRGCEPKAPTDYCENPGAPGAIVAINASDGSKKWARRLTPSDTPAHLQGDKRFYAAINTAPLVLKARGTVMFGDVNGLVHGYDLETGDKSTFMVDADCNFQSTYSLLKTNERPARGDRTYSQKAGVGTDPMVATGNDNALLLMGVNIEGGEHRLVAMRAGRLYNLTWGDAQAFPEGDWRSDQRVTVQGSVMLHFTDLTMGEHRQVPVPIRWFVVDKVRWEKRDFNEMPEGEALEVTLSLPDTLPPDDFWDFTIDFDMKPSYPDEGYIVGVIDPEAIAMADTSFEAEWLRLWLGLVGCPEFQEASELLYVDNFIDVPYKKQIQGDLEVVQPVQAPASAMCVPGGGYTASWNIRNHTGRKVDVPVNVRVESTKFQTYSLRQGVVTLEPGNNPDSQFVSVAMCDDSYRVVVEVNLGPEPRPVIEPTYANNAGTTVTAIGPHISRELVFQRGRGASIVVPADCVINVDPASRYPCYNYPDLRLD